MENGVILLEKQRNYTIVNLIMRRKLLRKFEKVSYEQFYKDYISKVGIYIPPDFEDLGYNIKNFIINNLYNTILIPKRATRYSAGYDFYSTVKTTLQPNETLLIPTGIKVYMEDDEVLKIYPRSSLGFKYQVGLANTVGIVDKDYTDNLNNEGHIFIKLVNKGDNNVEINIGDAVAQGIFEKYLVTDDDDVINERIGGIGSTGK